MNYLLITGPFAGSVVEEGRVLPLRFADLDEDMKIRVREFGEDKYKLSPDQDFPVSLDELVEEYENSWQSQETEDEVTYKP